MQNVPPYPLIVAAAGALHGVSSLPEAQPAFRSASVVGTLLPPFSVNIRILLIHVHSNVDIRIFQPAFPPALQTVPQGCSVDTRLIRPDD